MNEDDYLKAHAEASAVGTTGDTLLAVLRAYLSLPVGNLENDTARKRCLEMLCQQEAKYGSNVMEWDLEGIVLAVRLSETSMKFLADSAMMLSLVGLLKRK